MLRKSQICLFFQILKINLQVLTGSVQNAEIYELLVKDLFSKNIKISFKYHHNKIPKRYLSACFSTKKTIRLIALL